jgi:hypothetical protein
MNQRSPGPSTTEKKNQGEGDRIAARHYNEAAGRFAASGQVPGAAERARVDLDADAASFEAAERKGRAPASLSPVDRVLGALRRAFRLGASLLGRDDKHRRT